jgi:hypothetical protein
MASHWIALSVTWLRHIVICMIVPGILVAFEFVIAGNHLSYVRPRFPILSAGAIARLVPPSLLKNDIFFYWSGTSQVKLILSENDVAWTAAEEG